MTDPFRARPTLAPAHEYPERIALEGIVNTHTHPRDTDAEQDGRAELHIPLLAEVYEAALCMGNTKPPLTTPSLAEAKGKQWRALIPPGKPLTLLVGGLMTETTEPEAVVSGYDRPEGQAAWHYMKMFVRAASNAHGADVDDIGKIIPVLRAMSDASKFRHCKEPMTLAVHMERKYDLFGRRMNFLERERASVERDLSHLFREVPDARVVVCHVTDSYTLEVIRYLRSKGYQVWGEIAPHYSVWSCDDLVEAPDGGTMLNAHLFCLPVFKTEADRKAIELAMVSGESCWIHGCDDACWPDDPSKPVGVKINNRGLVIGGQTQLPKANISYVIEKFVEADATRFLNGYLSRNARAAYGLPPARTHPVFLRYDWSVEETLHRRAPHGDIAARVAMGGMARKYVPAAQLGQ